MRITKKSKGYLVEYGKCKNGLYDCFYTAILVNNKWVMELSGKPVPLNVVERIEKK